jgi:uncharacterized protein YqeY
MGLFKELQDVTVEQRKAAMAGTGGEHASYLAYIRAQAMANAKRDGNREPNDDDAEQAIRAEMKQNATLLKGDAGKKVDPLPESDYRTQVQARYDVLATLVPPMLEGDALAEAIRQAAADAGVIPDLRAMGTIMGKLKALYGARIDGALVKAYLGASG